MIEKIGGLILDVVLLIALLSACCGATVEEEKAQDKPIFVQVEASGGWEVVYHRETKVMYVVSRNGYSRGNFFAPLINADGTPVLWEDAEGK